MMWLIAVALLVLAVCMVAPRRVSLYVGGLVGAVLLAFGIGLVIGGLEPCSASDCDAGPFLGLALAEGTLAAGLVAIVLIEVWYRRRRV